MKNTASEMKILISTFSTLELVASAEIITIQADDNYSMVFRVGKEKITSNKSLGKYVIELESEGFIQCHKSYLINIKKIIRYHKNGEVEMEDGTMIPVARRRREDFLERLKVEILSNKLPINQNTDR